MYIFIHINIQYILYMCTVYCMHLHENQDVPVFTQRGCAPSTKTKPQMFIQWGSLASTRLSVCVLTSVCLILFHSPYSAFSHLLSFPFLPFFFFLFQACFLLFALFLIASPFTLPSAVIVFFHGFLIFNGHPDFRISPNIFTF